jgi:hypothetical protein
MCRPTANGLPAPPRQVAHRVCFYRAAHNAGELREQLPAQATRMGFPDVNCDQYFVASDDNAAIETLVAELLAASRAEKP